MTFHGDILCPESKVWEANKQTHKQTKTNTDTYLAVQAAGNQVLTVECVTESRVNNEQQNTATYCSKGKARLFQLLLQKHTTYLANR